MELTWKALPGVTASPDGSAYAEFWLEARGAAEPQVALAGVVRHIGPVLADLAPSRQPPKGRPGRDDLPATAS